MRPPKRRLSPPFTIARALRRLLFCTTLLAGPVSAADLTVSAAASLTNAFTDIGVLFERENPGTTVRLNFAASGALLRQIARGAPVDVFASADEDTMDAAERQRLLAPGTRIDFAGNVLVIVVPADRKATAAGLADLAAAGFARIAIGQPDGVPAGRYARSALEVAGLWEAVAPKTIVAQSVRQALDYVARGEVDAGFVYATDAASMPERVRVSAIVATPAPIRYPIAALADAADPAMALRFVRFVGSPAGRAVLARHGFGPP